MFVYLTSQPLNIKETFRHTTFCALDFPLLDGGAGDLVGDLGDLLDLVNFVEHLGDLATVFEGDLDDLVETARGDSFGVRVADFLAARTMAGFLSCFGGMSKFLARLVKEI